jgi:hypothetical protein
MHLKDVDTEVNLPRVRSILFEDATFIPAIDTDSWALERNYRNNDFEISFDNFLNSRKQIDRPCGQLKPEI